MNASHSVPRRSESGMTLIEVLVAILIFSIGLLGIVGLQARAIQFSVGAEDSNRAALLVNEISSNMQLYDRVDLTTDTTTAALLTAWQTRVSTPTSGGLANGLGSVTPTGARSAQVTITWLPPDSPAGADRHRYVTQVVLP